MRNARLIVVWAILIGLLALTVVATMAPLGTVKPVATMSIALVKAGLIYWVFMRLDREGGLIRVFAVGAAAWLVLLGLLSSGDLLTRGWLSS